MTQTKDKDWSEYPVDTKAFAINGGYWIKTERGWKWYIGSTFPTPGGDASGIIQLPEYEKVCGNQYPNEPCFYPHCLNNKVTFCSKKLKGT